MTHSHQEKPLERTSPRLLLLTAAGLWLLNIGLYFPSLGFGFINFDDYTVLLGHPHLYNQASIVASLKAIFFQAFPREEPLLLRDVTWALDSYFFGFKNPFGYHLGNVVLNSLNAVLLWGFLYLNTRNNLLAFIVSFLFSLVPVRVEPVCWVMGRKDVLVTFFMLTGLILQTLGLSSADRTRSRRLYLLTIAVTLAALLSKINALTYFMVLAAHFWLFPYFREGDSVPEKPASRLFGLPRVIPHLVISLFIFFWYRGIIGEWGVLDRGMESFSGTHIKYLLLFTPVILSLYVKLIFYPYDHSIFYQWPSVHQEITSLHMVWSAAAAVGFGMLTLLLFRRRKDLFFYWMVFLCLMLPYLNLQYIGFWIANRYVYFASFCILAILTTLILQGIKAQPRAVKIAALVLFAGYASLNMVQTLRYQHAWRSDIELWKYEASLDSPSIMALSTLAGSYITTGKNAVDPNRRAEFYDKATALLDKGFAVVKEKGLKETAPHLYYLYYYKGILLQAQGAAYQRQIDAFYKANDLKPGNASVLYKLAEVYYRMAMATATAGDKHRLARHSLDHFSAYMNAIRDDAESVQNGLLLLKQNYGVNFPDLEKEIRTIRENM